MEQRGAIELDGFWPDFPTESFFDVFLDLTVTDPDLLDPSAPGDDNDDRFIRAGADNTVLMILGGSAILRRR